MIVVKLSRHPPYSHKMDVASNTILCCHSVLCDEWRWAHKSISLSISCHWKLRLLKVKIDVSLFSQSSLSPTLPTLLHLQNSFRQAHLIFFAFLKSQKIFFEIGSRHPKPSVGGVGSVVDISCCLGGRGDYGWLTRTANIDCEIVKSISRL